MFLSALFTITAVAAAGVHHTANFSYNYGTNGCTAAIQCPVGLPGPYEDLNWRNWTARIAKFIASDEPQDLQPPSIYYYAGKGFEFSQATIDLTNTTTTHFDMQGMRFGCQPADDESLGRSTRVIYPERCTMTVKGFKNTTKTTGQYDSLATFEYSPSIQYDDFGYPWAEMGSADFSNPSSGNGVAFTGMKALLVTVANATFQATFLGIDDAQYTTYRK